MALIRWKSFTTFGRFLPYEWEVIYIHVEVERFSMTKGFEILGEI